MNKKYYNIIGLFILVIILVAVLVILQIHKDTKKGVAAMTDIKRLQAAIEQYKINYGQYPMSTPDNSSKILVETLQGNINYNSLNKIGYPPPGHNEAPVNSPKEKYYDFPQKRILNGEFISPFGYPYYYRENASKQTKTPDMHNPDSFDIWTQDAEGKPDGINNWGY